LDRNRVIASANTVSTSKRKFLKHHRVTRGIVKEVACLPDNHRKREGGRGRKARTFRPYKVAAAWAQRENGSRIWTDHLTARVDLGRRSQKGIIVRGGAKGPEGRRGGAGRGALSRNE